MASSKNSGDGRGSVSVFRPGQTVNSAPVTLDLATGREIFQAPFAALASNPVKVWESLGPVTLDAQHLNGNGLFLHQSSEPAANAFDILRTRLLHGLTEKKWRRIAITSPSHGCGKSFVAANLALSLARRPASRTVLMDLDLRQPDLARQFGLKEEQMLAEFLNGDQPLESVFRRYGKTLALGLNSVAVEDASSALHDPETSAALDAMIEQLDPEVVIYDMPPALANDDLLALASCIDAVLLVTDGTKSSPNEIKACERMLEGQIPLLGVVLNRAQDFSAGRYRYSKG